MIAPYWRDLIALVCCCLGRMLAFDFTGLFSLFQFTFLVLNIIFNMNRFVIVSLIFLHTFQNAISTLLLTAKYRLERKMEIRSTKKEWKWKTHRALCTHFMQKYFVDIEWNGISFGWQYKSAHTKLRKINATFNCCWFHWNGFWMFYVFIWPRKKIIPNKKLSTKSSVQFACKCIWPLFIFVWSFFFRRLTRAVIKDGKKSTFIKECHHNWTNSETIHKWVCRLKL